MKFRRWIDNMTNKNKNNGVIYLLVTIMNILALIGIHSILKETNYDIKKDTLYLNRLCFIRAIKCK